MGQAGKSRAAGKSGIEQLQVVLRGNRQTPALRTTLRRLQPPQQGQDWQEYHRFAVIFNTEVSSPGVLR